MYPRSEAGQTPDIAQTTSADETTTGRPAAPLYDAAPEVPCAQVIREADEPGYGDRGRRLTHQEMLDEILDTYSAAWKALAEL